MTLEEYRKKKFIILKKEEIFCQWCNHKDTYEVGKHSQPLCKKCGRNIIKNDNKRNI